MSEPKTQPTRASVAEFLAQQPDARRSDCEAIVSIMQRATGEPPAMWGPAIVGFGRYAYARSDGKTYEWPVTGFSPRKNDLTLYIMPGFDKYDGLMAKLGKHKTGKSCLYIKKLVDVDVAVLEALVVESVNAMEGKRIRSQA